MFVHTAIRPRLLSSFWLNVQVALGASKYTLTSALITLPPVPVANRLQIYPSMFKPLLAIGIMRRSLSIPPTL